MSLIAPIVRLARRIRLQQAEAELLFLEARAQQDIPRQRCRVASLRLQVIADNPRPPIDMITITRRIELAQKRDLLT